VHFPIVVWLYQDGISMIMVNFLQFLNQHIEGPTGARAADPGINNDMFTGCHDFSL